MSKEIRLSKAVSFALLLEISSPDQFYCFVAWHLFCESS